MDAPIALEAVYKTYEEPPVYVVRDFSLSVRRAEFFCLVGTSGCGKSTVLKLIAGIVHPTRGSVKAPDHVGMVFQSYALLPWLTAADNVAFAPRMRRLDKVKAADITRHYLQMVHLEHFSEKFPRELSGGQRQRVGLARALAMESDVLLMDEPFSALDPVITDELHADLLQIWRETRKTIVLVSHHVEEALTLADRIGIMKDGRLDQIIDVSLARPRHEDQRAFTREVKHIRSCLVDAQSDQR